MSNTSVVYICFLMNSIFSYEMFSFFFPKRKKKMTWSLSGLRDLLTRCLCFVFQMGGGVIQVPANGGHGGDFTTSESSATPNTSRLFISCRLGFFLMGDWVHIRGCLHSWLLVFKRCIAVATQEKRFLFRLDAKLQLPFQINETTGLQFTSALLPDFFPTVAQRSLCRSRQEIRSMSTNFFRVFFFLFFP